MIFTFIFKIADELGNKSVVCMVQIQKQEKIHMQHKIKMQCNNNLFRFIYSFNVRARKKNSQSKIHKCNFFSGEEGRIVDFTIILGAKSIYIFVL